MRCRACNIILSNDELRRSAEDWDYCTHCRFKSNEEFDIIDRQYVHGETSDVQTDGTPLSVDSSYMEVFDDNP